MRFTVRRIVHAHSVPTRRESQRRRAHTLWLSWLLTSPPAKMTQTTCRRPRHYLLQRLVRRLPRQRRHLQTTAVNVRCVWSGIERDAVTLVPCGHARFCATCVDRVVTMGTGCTICRADSRWWRVSITKHYSYYNEFRLSCFKMTLTCFCAFVCDFLRCINFLHV